MYTLFSTFDHRVTDRLILVVTEGKSMREKSEPGSESGTTTIGRMPISRRGFVEALTIAGASFATISVSARGLVGPVQHRSDEEMTNTMSAGGNMTDGANSGSQEIVSAKIRRALLSGPDSVTKDATVAELDAQGKMTVLRPGTNQWVCVPGNENIIGQADMCMDPMGMRWMLDAMARKPKPSNTTPGLIYMLNGATQHSYTDPFDRTSPAIPIGPHWMILWPFDARTAGLPTVMRDAGTLVMFAGTPYAHLHICGSPWDGNEYHPGDRGVWRMTYARA
jgi:hypothetical protein